MLSCSSIDNDVSNELKKIKPDDVSFSLMLALVVKEYVEDKTKKDLKIDDFESGLPDILGDIEMWKSLIEKMPVEEFKKLQKRRTQLGNLINKRVVKCL